MHRSTILLLASSALVAGAQTAVAAGQPPRLESCGGAHLLRPTGAVVLSCADGNSEIDKTAWTSWGASSATGTTDFWLNLCTPNCAASSMRSFPHSTVRLSDPTKTKQGLFFGRADVTYALNGARKTFTAYLAT